jgi:hypothetical protein
MPASFLKRLARRLTGLSGALEIRDELHRLRRDLNQALVSKQFANQRQLLDEQELKDNPRYRDPLRLPGYGFQVNSQNGEDGILHEILRRVPPVTRTFAEVGIGNGTENNTAFLLSQGWKGFWFDGDPALLQTLNGRSDLVNGTLKWHLAFLDRENIAGLFSTLGVPRELDVLSLDIDQNTYYLWDALVEYSPRVVVVEYNSSLPADVDWKVRYDPAKQWNGTLNFGASLKAYEKLGARLGYCLVGCDFNGINAFFVRQDLVGDRFVAPFTSENHYEPPRYPFSYRRGHPRSILDAPDPI